jgi:hypothetical protein
VGVPSSYLNNCIRPRVVALLSCLSASSKVKLADNNSKGTFSTLESLKHPTSNNGKWGRSYNWTTANATSSKSEPFGKPSKPWTLAIFMFFLATTHDAAT